jgi:hypothetical protein
MINAMYSRDISKKVKSARRTQAGQGLYVSAFAPYGYVKDAKDIHRLAIDEPAAAVVRRIFALAVGGQGSKRIADALNADGVLTPAAYKKQKGSNIAINAITPSLWKSDSVTTMLYDERYRGTLIFGKRENGALGTGERIYKPQSEWIRIPNAIPAIVTPDAWNAAHAHRKPTGRVSKKPDTGRMLYKKVLCGHCGHVLRYRPDRRGGFYFCETPGYTGEHGCIRGSYGGQVIGDAVKAVVQAQTALMLDIEKICQNGRNRIRRSAESAQAAAIGLEKEIAQLQAFKRQLYERFKKGALEKTEYLDERETVEADIRAKTTEREGLLARNGSQTDALDTAEQFFDKFKGFEALSEPTTEMVNALVESVRVYSRDRIEVKFACADELEKATQALNGLRQS